MRDGRWLVLLGWALAVGCGGAGASSKTVGGQCTTDNDCSKRCVTDKAFGTGMCTVTCTTDNDCPSGAVCLQRDNGICAVSCSTDRDCSDFGRGFVCKGDERKSGGESNICRLP